MSSQQISHIKRPLSALKQVVRHIIVAIASWYRVRLQDHLLRIHGMMADDSLLIFESHSADVGNAEFYDALEEMRTHFSWEGKRLMAKGTRELYLMRRLAA